MLNKTSLVKIESSLQQLLYVPNGLQPA